VTLNGSAEDVSINASGSSELDLTMFPADDADVHTSGSSQVTVHASGRLDAEVSGSSRIYYLGDPTLGRTHTSGSASIERK